MKTDRIEKILNTPISSNGKGMSSTNIVVKETLKDIIDEATIVKGAMILDGYDEEDSCIHYMNGFIKELIEFNKKLI